MAMREKVTAESAIKALQETASKVEDWDAFGRVCDFLAIMPSYIAFPSDGGADNGKVD
jgi:hypothetical protein